MSHRPTRDWSEAPSLDAHVLDSSWSDRAKHFWLKSERRNMEVASPSGVLGRRLFPAVSPVVAAVAFGDFGGPTELARDQWLPNDPATIVEHRLAGIALRMKHQGVLDIPSGIEDMLREAAFEDSVSTVEIVRRTLPVVAKLQEHGVPLVVSKGPGVAAMGRGVTERPFCDIDVLVQPELFGRATRLLRSWGYEERLQSHQPWPFFDRYCREAVNFRSAEGGSIDLHHHIPPWYWGRELDIGELIAASKPVSLYGQVVPVVRPAHNLVIVALHLMSDRNRPGTRLMIWRDLLVIAQMCNLGEAADFARHCGLDGWLRWVISQYPDRWRPVELDSRLGNVSRPLSGRRRLGRIVAPTPGTPHGIGQIYRLPVAHALLFLGGMLFPSRSFLTEQMPETPASYLRWWRSCLTRVECSPYPGGGRTRAEPSTSGEQCHDDGCSGGDAGRAHQMKRTGVA